MAVCVIGALVTCADCKSELRYMSTKYVINYQKHPIYLNIPATLTLTDNLIKLNYASRESPSPTA